MVPEFAARTVRSRTLLSTEYTPDSALSVVASHAAASFAFREYCAAAACSLRTCIDDAVPTGSSEGFWIARSVVAWSVSSATRAAPACSRADAAAIDIWVVTRVITISPSRRVRRG
jgi:hypothetical protein